MYGTVSKGILRQSEIAKFLGTGLVSVDLSNPASLDACQGFIGWGRKDNTRRLNAAAQNLQKPFIQLEDGFIGYWGHPSQSQFIRLSLIVDPIGIYYDARSPSLLESLINDSFSLTDEDLLRAKKLVGQITEFGITKYNSNFKEVFASYKQVKKNTVLVLDQTFGDKSVEFGLASKQNFEEMINRALDDNPEAQVWVKTHPDVIAGKKKGYLTDFSHPRVEVLNQNMGLKALFDCVDKVYAVTSQLGFEALLYGKQVHCFGVPFYAGWGLTSDYVETPGRRNAQPSLAAVVYAALVQYPRYLHPETQEHCEIESIFDWLALQQSESFAPKNIYAYGFTFWKRSFVRAYLKSDGRKIKFVKNIPKHLKNEDVVLCWGRSTAEEIKSLGVKHLWIMEDGFIRSVGLGANLKRPSSLVIDKSGIYYDAKQSSDLERILNSESIPQEELDQAKQLVDQLLEAQVTKYNVGRSLSEDALAEISWAKQNNIEVILVPGQVESDASIHYGTRGIKTNIDLLSEVRKDYPEALIIFKPHPDVLSGNREADIEIGIKKYRDFANLVLDDEDIAELYPLVNRVCVMSSLSGFEALIRGLSVDCYGLPFYSGWGLTQDKYRCERRNRKLTVNELVAGALIRYPLYLNWDTGLKTTAMQVVKQFNGNRVEIKSVNMLKRWSTKLGYLWEALKSR